MRHKFFIASLLAASLSAFVIGGAAQKSQQNAQGQTTQDKSKPGMMCQDCMMGHGQGMMGGMMGQGQGMMGGMTGMMGQMMAHHQKMSEMVNELMQSMTAIQNEKDPAALRSKLAEHGALLKKMHDQMMQQGNMMKNMSGHMKSMRTNCPMAGDVSKAPSE